MAATDTNMLDQAMENIQKCAQGNLDMQQEMFRQFAQQWPQLPNPQTAWLDQVRKFQRDWRTTVTEISRRHRESFDRQYQAALESFEETLNVTEAKDPDEFRRRSEQLVRKTLECVREISETQTREFQEAVAKWTEMVTKGA